MWAANKERNNALEWTAAEASWWRVVGGGGGGKYILLA